MRAVNLLPRDESRQKKQTNPVALVGAVGGCTVVSALAIAFMLANGNVATKQSEVEGLRVELKLIPAPPPAPSAAETQLAGQQTARNAALTAALAGRLDWDAVLRRFSLVLPEDVWLTSLTATAPPSAGAPGTLTITGYAYSHDGVARLLARLSVVPDLSDVQLQNSALSDLAGRDVAVFTIVASIQKVPAA